MDNPVFFFKQKTAYEMRISDWSSDVCSSDLLAAGQGSAVGLRAADRARTDFGHVAGFPAQVGRILRDQRQVPGLATGAAGVEQAAFDQPPRAVVGRSEEHTSELQSLMRISYAVFCLKKKKTDKQTKQNHLHRRDTQTA